MSLIFDNFKDKLKKNGRSMSKTAKDHIILSKLIESIRSPNDLSK